MHTSCFRKLGDKKCAHEGVAGGVSLTRDVVRVPALATVSFSLAIDPRAERVFLRRLVDLRHSLHRARLFVDGEFVRVVQSSDRPFVQMHTDWSVDTVPLPQRATRRKSRINIRLHIEDLEVEALKFARVFPRDVLVEPGTWPEAQWESVCVMGIDDD